MATSDVLLDDRDDEALGDRRRAEADEGDAHEHQADRDQPARARRGGENRCPASVVRGSTWIHLALPPLTQRSSRAPAGGGNVGP